MTIVMQLYTENEQDKQGEIQNVQFEEKKRGRKCNTGTKSCAPGDMKIKERLDSK